MFIILINNKARLVSSYRRVLGRDNIPTRVILIKWSLQRPDCLTACPINLFRLLEGFMWCECVLIISLSRKINFQTRHFNLDGTRHDGNIKLRRFTKVHYTSSKVSLCTLPLSVVSFNTRESSIVRFYSYLQGRCSFYSLSKKTK